MKKFIIALILLYSVFISAQASKIKVSGTVLNSVNNSPIEFATVVILEAKARAFTDRNGRFEIELDKPGEYTIIVNSDGLKFIQKKINITSDYNETFKLEPLSMKGAALTITAKKEKQSISRRTMTQEDMKETPASFGDSIIALTSLPGVESSDGIFGPLRVRGADVYGNRYYIDGMPVDNPMHMMGLNSVISTDIIEETDLYASSFPVNFGEATASVINITTIDNVEKFEGVVDISILSSGLILKIPIKKKQMVDGELKDVNNGYTIISGRIGYVSFLIPRIADMIGRDVPFVADYADYQIKSKYYLNKNNSVRFLAMGSMDKVAVDLSSLVDVDDGDDPLYDGLSFSNDTSFNNIGLYYDYNRGKISNTLFTFFSASNTRTYVNSDSPDSPDWLKDYEINNTPYIVSVKDDFSFEWWANRSTLDAGVAYTCYYFTVDGKALVVDNYSGTLDPYNDVSTIDYNKNVTNHVVSGYFDNKFKTGGLKLNTGARSDFLKRTGQATFDPRLMASYTFKTDTTISYAGGKYSSFFQTNPIFFAQLPNVCEEEHTKPIEAYHNAIGLEQLYDLFTVSVEGYYNRFTNEPIFFTREVDGEMRYIECTGQSYTYGAEVMLKKDRRENSNGLFGWVSYAYNISRYKTGLNDSAYDDIHWDKYQTSDAQRDHALKLVTGYKLGKHTLSGKFQLYSGNYYTPIVGDDSGQMLTTGMRYGEVYSTEKNSEQLPFYHRLDLRYTYLSTKSWGNIKWYIEVIDVYGLLVERDEFEDWKYNKPYSSSNPKMYSEKGFPIPNFGVEIRF